jgi:hypothetical protein
VDNQPGGLDLASAKVLEWSNKTDARKFKFLTMSLDAPKARTFLPVAATIPKASIMSVVSQADKTLTLERSK